MKKILIVALILLTSVASAQQNVHKDINGQDSILVFEHNPKQSKYNIYLNRTEYPNFQGDWVTRIGNNFYSAGKVGDNPVIYKNNEICWDSLLSDECSTGGIFDFISHGATLYATGYGTGHPNMYGGEYPYAFYWIDNERYLLKGGHLTAKDRCGTQISVYQKDVYVAGYEKIHEGWWRLLIWKNGEAIYIKNFTGAASIRVIDLLVFEGDIYLAGTAYYKGRDSAPFFMKNGEEVALDDGMFVTGIVANKDGVTAVANSRDGTIKYWHNGRIYEIAPTVGKSVVYTVFATHTDIYVGGCIRTGDLMFSAIWKNWELLNFSHSGAYVYDLLVY